MKAWKIELAFAKQRSDSWVRLFTICQIQFINKIASTHRAYVRPACVCPYFCVCLSIFLCVCLSLDIIHWSVNFLSICLFVMNSIHSCLFGCLSVCIFVCLCVHIFCLAFNFQEWIWCKPSIIFMFLLLAELKWLNTSVISECLSVCLLINLSMCLSRCMNFCLFVCLSVILSAYLFVFLSICTYCWLSGCPYFDCLAICFLSVCPSALHVFLSVNISVCLPVSLLFWLFTCVLVCLSVCFIELFILTNYFLKSKMTQHGFLTAI